MPSERHNLLSDMSLKWLVNRATGRGIRAGFEIALESDYIADVAALCTMQWRFAEQYSVIEKIKSRCEVIVPELLCVFEAKATRSDFLSTFGEGKKHENRKTPIDNLHWCVCSRNVASADDDNLPEFWGLLVPRGTGLSEIRRPTYCEMNWDKVLEAAYNILWYAKNNHGRYADSVYSDHRY